MARLFRQSITRYTDRDGKRCKSDAPGATKKSTRCKTWSGQYRDGNGVLRTVALYSDKEASRQKLSMLVQQSHHERSGLRSPFADAIEKPLAEHLADYVATLKGRGLSAVYVANTERYAKELLTGCKFFRWPEVSASAVQRWLGRKREEGRGLVVLNHLLMSAKQFFGWLVEDRRAPENPLACLSKLNAELEQRRPRRALTEEEISRLLHTTQASPKVRQGMNGISRSMLYRLCLWTGLRASEAASMTPRSFDFQAGTLTVEAAFSKHGKTDVMPLPSDLAEHLQAWMRSRSVPTLSVTAHQAARLWPGDWAEKRKGAEMLRGDLKAAGIEFETADGRVDFHSLRTSFVTRLSKAGVALTDASRLARHSDVRLTMKNYTKLTLTDLSAAIEKLPEAQPVVFAADGTTGKPVMVTEMVTGLVTVSADFACQPLTTSAKTALGNTFRNSLLNKTVDNDCGLPKTGVEPALRIIGTRPST